MLSRRTVITRGAGLGLLALLGPWRAAAAAEALPPADARAFESLEQVTALAAQRPTVLYFHADWCPTCQATMTSFEARWPEVRDGLMLVIADYDAETALKARYGVTYQNTFVQVAADGSRMQSWNGGGIEALNARTIFPDGGGTP